MKSKNHHLNSRYYKRFFDDSNQFDLEVFIKIDYLDYDYLIVDNERYQGFWLRLAREKEETYKTIFGKRKKYFTEYGTQVQLSKDEDKHEILQEMVGIKYGEISVEDSLFYKYLEKEKLEQEERLRKIESEQKEERITNALIKMIREDLEF